MPPTGILDFSLYIPYHRLSREAIGEAWRLEQARALLVGERAVAGFDEDTITMAVEAVLEALGPREGADVETVFFASTTPPFGEKSSAAVVAAAAHLPVRRSVDVTGSLRAGTSAFGLALDAVSAAPTRRAVVVAVDMRTPEPGTLTEAVVGDGAAALLVGQGEDVIAVVEARVHMSAPTFDSWRYGESRYVRADDEAFAAQVGYFALVRQAVEALLHQAGVSPEAIAGTALYTPDGRAYMRLARQLPFAPSLTRMGPNGPAPRLLMRAGNLGTAFPLAQLALLLESARPDDLILLVGYGDGVDAYLLRVTQAIGARPPRRPGRFWLETAGPITYTQALFFRGHIRDKPLFPPSAEPWTSLPLLHREQDALLALCAQRCTACGAVWWPHRPNCYECGAQDHFETVRLSRRGTVATFEVEWALPLPHLPVGMVTVDTPEGARLTTQSTDGDPRTLGIGQDVELAFRLFHMAKAMPHYAWKVRVRS
ncbi:MAG: OB-fold domain-containing protein [Ardenticatenia bacterium]|nr:OB-fold domain-containing protein [Ardenticatenia bacterium]